MSRYIKPGYNVVAIPFPVWPRRVVYGELAKVLDYIEWKRVMGKTNGETNGEHSEEYERVLSLSEDKQKLWLIQRMFEVLKDADREDLEEIFRVLTKDRKPPGA